MLLTNYARLSDAVREVYGNHWPMLQQNNFVTDARAALDEPGCTVTEDEAIAALQGAEKPLPSQRGDWWIGALCKAKSNGARDKRGQSISEPADAETFRLAIAQQQAEEAARVGRT